jgi:predicted glycosyltransferase
VKVLFEIGHPANVHYFKNLISRLKNNEVEVFIVARKTKTIEKLLKAYDFPFISRGMGADTFLGKLVYMIYANLLLFRLFYKYRPKFFVSFGSPYGILASVFFRFNTIVLDDTEVGTYEQIVYRIYSKIILTPEVFYKKLGRNHVRVNTFMELSYLHSKYFSQNPLILRQLGVNSQEKIILIRTVAWKASHDVGHAGIGNDQLVEVVNFCKRFGKVYISSEEPDNSQYPELELKISPEQLHDVLSYCSLYIGEGATTASECVMLGIPAIYVNSINAGTLMEQEKSGLLYSFRNFEGVIECISNVMDNYDRNRYIALRDNFIKGRVDVNELLYWYLFNYPKSDKLMKSDSNIQNLFLF